MGADEVSSIDIFLGNRHATTDTKCAAGYLQSGRGLLAFILVKIDTSLHPAHCVFIESVVDNVARTQVVLDIKPQDLIENLVGRKDILILLIWLQLRAGRLFDYRFWNDFALATGRVRPSGGLASSRGVIGVDPAR